MSLIHTCELNGAHSLDYLTELQRNAEELRRNLAVFAEFEREILRERVRAGLAHARQNGKRPGRRSGAPASANPRSPGNSTSAAPPSGASWTEEPKDRNMARARQNHDRESRIHEEIIVDA
jgi:hypothetical protein